VQGESPLYSYTVEPMPPSRLGRRWRWTLFRGERLLAAGWRLSERAALQGIRTAAARSAHEATGLRALRPERVWPDAGFRAGMTVRCEAGTVACVLAPRELEAAAA
jgi:hypothetical protein